MRILLIEDDKLIGDGIKAGLTKLGFNLDWFTDGAVGKNALGSAPYDAVILDLSLPGLDGLDLLRQWRQAGQDVPVLILTARDALEQRVSGLQSGADDYLCKPFALAEVAARLQALIRRRHGQLMPQLTHGNVVFDSATRSVSCNGEQVTLTPRELAVLELFLHNKGRVLARPLIQEKLYNWDDEVSSNAVEVHIHHLRRKLGNGFIRTIHGVGYTLGMPREAPQPAAASDPDFQPVGAADLVHCQRGGLGDVAQYHQRSVRHPADAVRQAAGDRQPRRSAGR